MTTAAPPQNASAAPSIHVVRARKLLVGGLAGGAVATVIAVLVCALLYGGKGATSAAIAAVVVLFFYIIGQAVMVLFADAGARTLMAVSMGSYFFRVAVLCGLLALYNANSARWASLTPKAVFIATFAVVLGWLAVEILVFTRLRMTIYDAGYDDPSPTADADARRSAGEDVAT